MNFDAWITKRYGTKERRYTETDLRSAWHAGEEDAIERISTSERDRARYAGVVIDQMKARTAALRIELKDALFLAYGTESNWPKTALTALGDTQ